MTLAARARWAVCALWAVLATGCGTPGPGTAPSDDDLLIVAVADTPEPGHAAGSTPRARYGGSTGYAGSTRAEALAAEVARDHGLREQKFWGIAPLQLRCMLYRIGPGHSRAAVLAALAADRRVALAQPLQQFQTLARPAPAAAPALAPAAATAPAPAAAPAPAPAPPSAPAPAAALAPAAGLPLPGPGKPAGAWPGAASTTPQDARYDDPYIALQHGFAAIQAGAAQQWTRGAGVRVALIDTAVDSHHPDLAGRLAGQRNFVDAGHPAAPGGEGHGTQMAGVIAAVANNRLGIVGIAPQARLLAYRACWPAAAAAGASGGGGAALCNSFTLAQALGAAIADGSDIINLSLGGPPDPLLQRLVEHALRQGTVVVGAVAPALRDRGWPAGVPGVLAVVSSDDALPGPGAGGLAAPGRDILTLAPGGGYGYASGSSLAAAHVSGAAALLRALQPGLPAATLRAWLNQPGAIDLCLAVRHLRPAAVCAGATASR